MLLYKVDGIESSNGGLGLLPGYPMSRVREMPSISPGSVLELRLQAGQTIRVSLLTFYVRVREVADTFVGDADPKIVLAIGRDVVLDDKMLLGSELHAM